MRSCLLHNSKCKHALCFFVVCWWMSGAAHCGLMSLNHYHIEGYVYRELSFKTDDMSRLSKQTELCGYYRSRQVAYFNATGCVSYKDAWNLSKHEICLTLLALMICSPCLFWIHTCWQSERTVGLVWSCLSVWHPSRWIVLQHDFVWWKREATWTPTSWFFAEWQRLGCQWKQSALILVPVCSQRLTLCYVRK